MSGNSNQYDPTAMFKDWIQKSGRAQTEFMKSFGSLMGNESGYSDFQSPRYSKRSF